MSSSRRSAPVGSMPHADPPTASARAGLFGRIPWLGPVIFIFWSALVLLRYYLADAHAAGLAAIVAVWSDELPAAAALFVAGGAAIHLIARQRRASLFAGWGGLALTGLLALAAALNPGTRGRVLVVLLAILLLAAAVALGALILRLLGVRTRSAVEELAWAGSLGLGALSLAFALAGLAGFFRPWALAAAMLAGLAAGWRDLWRLLPRLASSARRARARAGVAGNALLLLLVALFAWRALHSFAPPRLGEADYDALEYHLAAPLEWLAAGRIGFMPHNVYANMPAFGEMLYAPGLGLLPDFLPGYCFAKLVGLCASALAAMAAAAAAARLAGRRAGIVAGGILFAGTWLGELNSAPFVEHFLLLHATVAWGAFAAWVARRPAPGLTAEARRAQSDSAETGAAIGGMVAGRTNVLLVAALAAGFAAGTKYPAAIFVAAPMGGAALLAVIIAGWRTRPAAALVQAASSAAVFGVVVLAIASPWYVRNWLADGDPFYPLATSAFPSRHWSEIQRARWDRAHSPHQAPATALRGAFLGRPISKRSGPDREADLRSHTAWQNVFTGPLAICFALAVPLALVRRRRPAAAAALWLSAFLAIYVALWASLTHQIDRFLWPCYGLLAALVAIGASALRGRLGRGVAPATVLCGALLAFPAEAGWLALTGKSPDLRELAGLSGTGAAADEDAARTGPGPAWEAIAAINALPAGSRVLLVGEARAALFRTPVIYATVFDAHPLEEALAASESPRELAARLQALGVSHIFCNWQETNRLRATYATELSDDERRLRQASGHLLLPDGRLPGCFALTAAKAQLLDAFERDYLECVEVWGPQGRSPLTGRTAWPWELWRMKSPE